MRFGKAIFFLFVTTTLAGQSTQESYLSGKSEYKRGNYSSASMIFSGLTNDQIFGSYSTFYLGLTKHKNGENKDALDAWRQLLVKDPHFSEKGEVHFWMTYVFLADGQFERGIQEAEKLDDDTRKQLYGQFLSALPFTQVRDLFRANLEDRELATMTIKKGLNENELASADQYFIDGVMSRLNIESEDLGGFPILKKERYSIAVMLPFLFDGLDKMDNAVRNTLVMDLYHGMMLAKELLAMDSILIDLYPYDTRRDSTHTLTVFKNKEMNKVDAIVGPLFPGPLSVARAYSLENKINLINPVSGNTEGIKGNPYAFILKPDYSTLAYGAADYMARTTDKREANIYFENKPAERTIAKEYKKAIEELGFEVIEFLPIDGRSARQVLAKFKDQEEIVHQMTEEEVQQEKAAGRLIRDRRKFDASGNVVLKEDGTPELEYFELGFTADIDSLDHMFAVTKSNLLANNFVGAVESRSDTVRLLGMGEWLDFTMLDYKQLERLNVILVHPDYYDRKATFYLKVEAAYRARFKKHPTRFSLAGFESVWWLGTMMSRHGKYFQNGFYEKGSIESVFSGHQFTSGKNDNQVVPIVQFVNQELKSVNIER